jgi:hypothetical protein
MTPFSACSRNQQNAAAPSGRRLFCVRPTSRIAQLIRTRHAHPGGAATAALPRLCFNRFRKAAKSGLRHAPQSPNGFNGFTR